MVQQTAVELLEEFLNKHCNPSVCDVEWSDFKLAIQEAKQVEANQNEYKYQEGYKDGVDDVEW
jgi:hypothetical protein